MAELTPAEKLQPCLLDRLTDDEPHRQKESRTQRIMSMTRYRQSVLRDLAWLLNTSAHMDQDGLDDFEELPSSVLNYGVQSLTGVSATSLDVTDMRYRLIEALQRFEPRILANSISIFVTMDPEEMSNRSIRFEIRGDLWAQPMPEALYIQTEIDLETGHCQLQRGARG